MLVPRSRGFAGQLGIAARITITAAFLQKEHFMLRLLFALSLLAPLNGQILVDTFAGGQIPPGALGFVAGLTWDSAGNIVFCGRHC